MVYAMARIPIRKNIRVWIGIKLMVLLGLGFAAIQLVPTVSLLSQANITTTASSFIFDKFLMPLSHLVTIIIPNYFGNPGTYNFWGKTDYVETVAAVGSIAITLAGMGLFAKKTDTRLLNFFAWGSIITIALTLDWPLTQALYKLPIPILSTNIPTRLYMLTTFFVSVLASFGVQAIFDKRIDVRKIRISILIVGLVLGVGVIVAWMMHRSGGACMAPVGIDCWRIAYRNSIVESVAFGVFFLALWIRPRFGVYAALGLISVLGIYNSFKILPMSPPSYVFPKHEVIAKAQQESPNRVFGFDDAAIATDIASYYKFFDANYYDPLYIRRYGEFISYVNTGDVQKGVTRSDVEIIKDEVVPADVAMRRKRAFDLLGVSQFIVRKNNAWVFQDNLTALPRARLVYKTEMLQGTKLLERLFDPQFSIGGSVLLDTSVLLVPDPSLPTKGDATIVMYAPERVEVRVSTPQTAMLVLSDNYEKGWKARIDGEEVPVYRANYTFRAVIVPPGEHHISMEYRPVSFVWGAWISTLSLLVWLGLVLWYNIVYGHKRRTAKVSRSTGSTSG
jgi:hypothetical protein